MRVNCSKALKAFAAGKDARPAESIHTFGGVLWSYGTPLAVKVTVGDREGIVLNRTRYSVTTTIHQNAIAAWSFEKFGLRILAEVDGIRMGAHPDALYLTAGYPVPE